MLILSEKQVIQANQCTAGEEIIYRSNVGEFRRAWGRERQGTKERERARENRP